MLKGIQLIHGRTTTNPGLSKIRALNRDPKLPVKSGLVIEKRNPSVIIIASYVRIKCTVIHFKVPLCGHFSPLPRMLASTGLQMEEITK